MALVQGEFASAHAREGPISATFLSCNSTSASGGSPGYVMKHKPRVAVEGREWGLFFTLLMELRISSI